MTPRPLVRRTPDGRRYTVPSRLPKPAGAESVEPLPQPASTAASRPKRTRGATPALTDADVQAIRADYPTGKCRQADLASSYGVGLSTIQAVLQHRGHYAYR